MSQEMIISRTVSCDAKRVSLTITCAHNGSALDYLLASLRKFTPGMRLPRPKRKKRKR